jgi:bifunctional NMN adenylyltransferase/nudix hydrolase
MAKQNVGVVVGRFQVPELHDGHRQLLAYVSKQSDLLVVLVGVSPIDGYAPEHPLTFAQRAQMLGECCYEGMLVLPVMDVPTNQAWSEALDTMLRNMFPTDDITLYGGRDSFIPKYSGKLPTVIHLPSPEVDASGSTVRAAFKIENQRAFMRGQIYALNSQYPEGLSDRGHRARARQSRDVGVMEVLLIQRADTGAWCFPGGFVDPTDGTYEQAAKRELSEEVGLMSEAPLEYIGSAYIHDWRYRSSRDCIMTTFFLSHHTSGFAKLKTDEVTEARYVRIAECRDFVANAHKPLAQMLVKFMQKEGL